MNKKLVALAVAGAFALPLAAQAQTANVTLYGRANLDMEFVKGKQLKAGVKYPPTFFTTSTRDDRVHPGHARKMMASMSELGQDVLYYENIEGGHGGAANNQQAAHMAALEQPFLGAL